MRSRLRASVSAGLAFLGMLNAPGVVRGEGAAAPPAPAIDGADTAFVLIAAALVMVMTPGLGLFYGGMVRRQNVLATVQQSVILLGLITIPLVLFCFNPAFRPHKLHWLLRRPE